MSENEYIIKIPKKAFRLVLGAFLIMISLVFACVTLANFSEFQSPFNLLLLWVLLGMLGVFCLFWERLTRLAEP